ncbi:MAG: hypothetical protein YSLV7_ORF16 [Yellowstone Lake virophage 7]|uniref:hypothetical protein n=1 Tax=Yellowstone Lake virophage 7 TaxID=1557035 RepID=UPI00053630F4|nr:MAG: hypothetical protein ASQ67_gp16 [Yellowstone Lake virophage 7]AIW01935.1 MAG: hypothetical protein YSLV7_ORF16 [Yellowstone Lake virophage 7]
MSAKTIFPGGNTQFLPGLAGLVGSTPPAISTSSINCQTGELQAATAQIGFGSAPGEIILQVGNPSGTNANFSIGTGVGNPLTIARGISASSGNITAPTGTINAFNGITTTNGGFIATAGGLTCTSGEVQAATAQIGFGSTTGDVIFQVGNPDDVAVNFSVGAGAGNPLTIGSGLTCTAGGLTCASGEVVAATAQIGAGSTTGDVIFQVGNPDDVAVNFSVGTGAGNPLTIGSAIKAAGLVDANGSTGENGQYPIANGTGGFVWTTP